MICIGIDPGLSGAVAALGPHGAAEVFDLPTVPLPGTGLIRKRIHGRALTDILRRCVPAGESCMVIVEMVRAMGGPKGKTNALQTQGSLSRTLGAIEAVLDVLRVKPTMVEAQTWKRYYRLDKAKHASLQKARELFPDVDLRLAKHHNKAEALLIAHWGMRTKT